ncbi:MAG: YHYH protein [Leptospirales bacterium]|nr:YHYH protein [Leptospirales bacterium]
MTFRLSPFFLAVLLLFVHCEQLGLTSSDDDSSTNLALLLAAAALTANPCTSSISAGAVGANSSLSLASGCVSGVSSSMDSSLPSWIRNNFKCSVGYTVSGYYCFKSLNLVNAHSAYYRSGSLNEAFNTGGGKNQNPNTISSQNFVYAIPSSPTRNTGSLTGTQGGLVSIGIGVNGLAVFNNAAAPPDTLSVEALTFDDQEGHPENTGSYHHHSQFINGDGAGGTPASVNLTTLGSGANLIGIALDGYAIYGQYCQGQGGNATGLDAYHGHTTTTAEFTTPTYHYHYGGNGTGGGNDTTAGIPTLMGSFFYGNVGKVSN